MVTDTHALRRFKIDPITPQTPPMQRLASSPNVRSKNCMRATGMDPIALDERPEPPITPQREMPLDPLPSQTPDDVD
jgi:hypothetical protein